MKKNRIKILLSYLKKNLPLIISIIFWIIISVFLVSFVNMIFKTNEEKVIERQKILILFLVLLSIGLLIFIIIYLIKLIISMKRKEFGSMLRFKITAIFIFIVLLPIIPFIQIGSKFIESSMDIWFSENIGIALDLSEELIKSYYSEKKFYLIDSVETVNNYLQNNSIKSNELKFNIDNIFNNIKVINISLWSNNGEFIVQAGDNIFDMELKSELNFSFDEYIYLYDNYNGIFYQKKGNNLYLIIPSKILKTATNESIGFFNIAILINPNFNKVTVEIDNSLKNYNIVSLYKKFFISGFSILFIGVLFPIILIVLVISIFLTKELVEPIASLSDAIKRIAKGEYNFKIVKNFNDEFKILTDSFNSMISEIEFSRRKLQQREKIATWQEIARRLAHEIKNPLTPIRLNTERIRKKHKERASDFEDILEKGATTIINEVERMNKLLVEFSNIAKLPNTIREKGGIYEIIKDSVDLLSVNQALIDIKIEFTNDNDYTIMRDPVQLKSVFVNIIKNGIDATKTKGDITITISEKKIGFSRYVLIAIRDHGEGVLINEGDDIFEPYFSTKENGVGLGLAISQRIVQEHDGRIYYESIKGEGTTFFIELPVYIE